MIPKLFISPYLETRVGEINKFLAFHLPGVESNSTFKIHPDVLYFEAESKLGIEQAREIKEHFSQKPYQAEGRVLVIEESGELTHEAQNALLKTFEEAPEKALIILGAKSEQDLLPTILSRCEIVTLSEAKGIYSSLAKPGQNDRYIGDIEKLLNSTIEERFEYIEKLKEREEFLHALTLYFRGKLHAPKESPGRLESQKFLKELLEAEKWAAQNVNIRAILEYLMLVMPKQ